MIVKNTTTRILILGITTLMGLGLAVLARAQRVQSAVLIQVHSGSLRVNTPFVAHVKNDLAVPITLCTDFSKAIQAKAGPQVAPNPFEIQKRTGKRWGTQLLGTDVSSGNTAISIDARESRDFTLQINAPGRYRLRLTYLEGESNTKCPPPVEHAITISSKPFSMHPLAQK